ncbi:hypothetical protein PPL_08602 [Heterostelium album PN500]|uniref:Terpene synthase n=1 Tax=Heterostelium pallidum (strain ATCC 26659 / Pp 5 / PN500) TaxID=670386 RepID=D3BJ77_HETP5|nr:hypothetical protein PPL_08602 [Heterostelium album PN500]EFA77957.1 hypothetical protein PPL_08602 [Heterostelium album PN500]|eukprot:XP_020430085.1 hypothetical protein PPL_08602 [Heterostelium album PN500]
MFSIKKIIDKIPKQWSLTLNPNDPWEELNQKMEESGLIDRENPEKYSIMIKSTSLFVRNIWSTADQEEIILATQFILVSSIFDDLIDSHDEIFGIKYINRFINIFKLDKIEKDPTPLERIALNICKNLENRLGNQHPLLNLFKNTVIEYLFSLLPFKNMKKLKGDIDMNLYYMMRRNNIGMRPTFYLSSIFSMKRLNPEIVLDPLWSELIDQTGNIVSLFNDLFSYEKELRANDERMNCFHFIQTQRSWSVEECLEFFEKEIDNCLEKFLIDENLLKQKYYSILKTQEDIDEFNQLVEKFHYMMSAIVTWYSQKSKKYKSENSIFVELRY